MIRAIHTYVARSAQRCVPGQVCAVSHLAPLAAPLLDVSELPLANQRPMRRRFAALLARVVAGWSHPSPQAHVYGDVTRGFGKHPLALSPQAQGQAVTPSPHLGGVRVTQSIPAVRTIALRKGTNRSGSTLTVNTLRCSHKAHHITTWTPFGHIRVAD